MTNGEKQKISRALRDRFDAFLANFKSHPHVLFRLILLGVACVLIAGNWYFFERHENYRIGRPAAKTYFAITSTRYEDKSATMELRRRAAARIADVMVRDERLSAEVERKLDLLDQSSYTEILSPALIELLGRQNSAVQSKVLRSVKQVGEKLKDSSESREQQTSLIWDELKNTPLSQSEQNIAFQLLDAILNPTLQTDSELASRLREDVATQIPEVIREIHTGSVLVQKGQVVTPSLARLLKSQGYPDAGFPIKKLVFILVCIFAWSLWPVWIETGFRSKLSVREWLYISVVLATTWMLELFFAKLGGFSMAVLGLTGWLCLTLPVSLSYHIIFGGGLISVMIAFGTNPGYVALACILSIFSASIGRILFLDPPNHRVTIWRNLFLLGLCLGAISVFVHWGLGIYFNYGLPLAAILFSAIWGTIVVALLPFWEYLFDVISPLRLLELSHPSQPILKRLQLEAPGTYHHTLMVGTLAEAAADKLKLNGLMVKAGAYYHDIGKLKNPRFFVENQLKGENIHDELSPSLSALVIISHVREGLELADEIKLPKTLHRFISEHHGTTIQKYFFEKARALDDSVTEEQFRYFGPRPQSKETAIVMLADSVEAAVKARSKPFENIRELQILVNSVVASKIEAEQFRDVDFTIKDIAVIKDSFVELLRSSYHSREVKEIEARNAAVRALQEKESILKKEQAEENESNDQRNEK
ncbi:HDIG domain-containing protein [Synergistaceae bacterium OttesenSCG-928-D05]|nr:HDIG domain-containing protein [Synergistaceae bacterium OttesenSCG-928-D05]